MSSSLREDLWNQFGASIDMLENAIKACPPVGWDTNAKFWYNAYHCLFFLDYYLTLDVENFRPPTPFTLSEFEEAMPERVYSQHELLTYLQFCRVKCHDLLAGWTDERAKHRWTNVSGSMNYSLTEILLYNMRHVQHHAAQLNLVLRQTIDDAPDWVFQAQLPL
ncbi:hypothetical protein GCM10028819_36330 [Spirosoma humi]